MTNKKEVAQKVLEAYETSYTESGLVAALRELAFELQYYQCCGDEGAEDMVLDARDVLDVCDELEVMTEEIDISKVLIEGDTATIMGVKYKRIEEPKSPVEEGYKKVFGYYPVTDIGDAYWEYFQKGYEQSQKDYKVGEFQEPAKNKVLLYKRFENEGAYGQIYYDDALKVVKGFLMDEGFIEDENDEYITFTLQKSLLDVPNDY